jgi:hypothetical protein
LFVAVRRALRSAAKLEKKLSVDACHKDLATYIEPVSA